MTQFDRRKAVLMIGAGLAALGSPASARQFSLSEGQASLGVREALTRASRLATERLGRTDGFNADPLVHIPLPGRIRDLQSMLRRVGLSGDLDRLELQLNRSAEAAMPAVGAIFVDAVRSITLTDAIGIVRGGSHSATDYLRGRTWDQLYGLVRPRMVSTLESSGAYRSLRPIEERIDRQSGGWLGGIFGRNRGQTSLRDQVTNEATRRTLEGVFHYVGQEEEAIRRDPVSRTSDILRRVFG